MDSLAQNTGIEIDGGTIFWMVSSQAVLCCYSIAPVVVSSMVTSLVILTSSFSDEEHWTWSHRLEAVSGRTEPSVGNGWVWRGLVLN